MMRLAGGFDDFFFRLVAVFVVGNYLDFARLVFDIYPAQTIAVETVFAFGCVGVGKL